MPKMSANRPRTGIETAPVRSVTVMIHEVLVAEVEKISGSEEMSGMTRVWVSDEAMPAAASTATIRFGWSTSWVCSTGLLTTVTGTVS
nr:hypothetical protein [Actinomyces provencensis]